MAPQCMGQRSTFILMMVLTTSFFFVEIIVGYITNSMALVADSFHMLSDIISLFVGFLAMRYSKITNGNVFSANTFGWARAEVLGALVNAVFLVALCFSILVEALKRLVEAEGLENPNLILVVGGAGLLVNLIGMLLFHGHAGHGHSHGGGHTHSHGGHNHTHKEHETTVKTKEKEMKAIDVGLQNLSFDGENYTGIQQENAGEYVIAVLGNGAESNDTPNTIAVATGNKNNTKRKRAKSSGQMNMRGVYLHILGDALGSVIVIVAALIVKYFDGKWTLYVDPVMSIIMVGIILKTSVPLLKESSTILLQHVPSHIELQKLQAKLLGTFPEIVAVHEFHVWQLTGSRIVASLHVMFASSEDYGHISSSLKQFFHKEGIHSTTVQPEFIAEDEVLLGQVTAQCLLACVDEACAEKVCCKPEINNKGNRTSSRSSRSQSREEERRSLSMHSNGSQKENKNSDFVQVNLDQTAADKKNIEADKNKVEIQIEENVDTAGKACSNV